MKKIVIRILGGFINTTAVLFPKWNAEYTFRLLCKVKRAPISEKGKQFLDAGTPSFFKIDDHSAVLHQWGTGSKKVLFLHGWMSNSQRWGPYADRLDLNEHTVYALDAPGHGMADGNYLNVEVYRRALVHVIQKIGLVDTLVCHSLGSLVGSYAYLYNRNLPVQKFVIMGSPSGMDAIFTYFEDLVGLSKKALMNLEAKIDSVLQLPHGEVELRHFFRKVHQPVLVVHEVTDRITPIEPIKRASEEKIEITTFFTRGQDHNLKGSETIEKVIQFIKD